MAELSSAPSRFSADDGTTVEASLAQLERAIGELKAASGEQMRLLRAVCDASSRQAPASPQTLRLRAAIVDAVGVLDATRSSFKSRQLEALRRRLIEVLGTD